jgi:hypothetical protein
MMGGMPFTIEKMWAILKKSTRGGGCESPEELFRWMEQAWSAIPLEQVGALVDRYQTMVRAFLALQGRCVNGNREVLSDLEKGRRTVVEIQVT